MIIFNLKNLYKNIYLLLYFLIFFINIIYRITILKYLLYFLGFISLAYYFLYVFLCSQTKIKKKQLLIFLFILPTMIFTMFYNHNLSFFSYCILLSYLGIAFLLINTRIILELSYIPFIINVVYLIIYYFSHNHMEGAFAEQSVNYVSVIILYSLVLIYVSQFQNNVNNDNYLLIAIGVFLSLVAGGRGGLLSIVFLFGLTFLNNLLSKKKKDIIVNCLVISCVLFIIIYYGIIKRNIWALFGTGFAERGMDSNGRTLVWGIYLLQCLQSPLNILFGVNIVNTIPIEIFPHLHSSYLTLYADFGLIAFISILILLVKIVFNLYRINRKLCFLFL